MELIAKGKPTGWINRYGNTMRRNKKAFYEGNAVLISKNIKKDKNRSSLVSLLSN